MTEPLDFYHKWLGIPPEEQPPNHYRLLGIPLFESDADVIINAAYQRAALVRTFQIGQHSDTSQRLLNDIAAAKVCLLNTLEKAEYDDLLRQESPGGRCDSAPAVGSGETVGSLDRVAGEPPVPPPVQPRKEMPAASVWDGWLGRQFPMTTQILAHFQITDRLLAFLPRMVPYLAVVLAVVALVKLDGLRSQIEDVEGSTDTLWRIRGSAKRALFDTHRSPSGFACVNEDSGPAYFVLVMEEVRPHPDGLEVTMKVGNPASMTFVGLRITVARGGPLPGSNGESVIFEDDRYLTEESKKAKNQWWGALKRQDVELTDRFEPGQWHPISFVLRGAKPEETRYLLVHTIETNRVFFEVDPKN